MELQMRHRDLLRAALRVGGFLSVKISRDGRRASVLVASRAEVRGTPYQVRLMMVELGDCIRPKARFVEPKLMHYTVTDEGRRALMGPPKKGEE